MDGYLLPSRLVSRLEISAIPSVSALEIDKHVGKLHKIVESHVERYATFHSKIQRNLYIKRHARRLFLAPENRRRFPYFGVGRP